MKELPYQLTLTGAELETLAWLTDRGYFPAELYDSLECIDEDANLYGCEEHCAWSLTALRDEDPDAYLACLGGDLLDKILALEQEIV